MAKVKVGYAMSKLDEKIKKKQTILKKTVNFYKSIETESQTQAGLELPIPVRYFCHLMTETPSKFG